MMMARTTTLSTVTRTRDRSTQARSDFEQAIRDAHAGGESMRKIAVAAGLSYQRVHQILHGK